MLRLIKCPLFQLRTIDVSFFQICAYQEITFHSVKLFLNINKKNKQQKKEPKRTKNIGTTNRQSVLNLDPFHLLGKLPNVSEPLFTHL